MGPRGRVSAGTSRSVSSETVRKGSLFSETPILETSAQAEKTLGQTRTCEYPVSEQDEATISPLAPRCG